MYRVLMTVALAVCSIVTAQGQKNLIVLSSLAGIVDLIDPATLETVGRLRFDIAPPPGSAGLNEVAAGADGRTLYVEGPIPSNPHGCCSLYSIDLETLQAKLAADIRGSASRSSLVFSDGLIYHAAALAGTEQITGMANDRLHLSPDGRWLFGVRGFRGPALDVYDLARGEIVRRLTPAGVKSNSFPSGTWTGGHFYFYAANDDGSGRLWTVTPESTQLGEGVAVAQFGQVRGCRQPFPTSLAAAGGNLFLYEVFGFKADRREACEGQVPGGAWIIDPATGQLLRQVASDLHFSALIPDRAEPVLYGLAGAALVLIDAQDGRILKSRTLDSDFLMDRHSPAPVS